MNDARGGEDLPAPRQRAQAGSRIQSSAAIAASFHRHRLAGVQPDPDLQRKRLPVFHRLSTAVLHTNGCAQRLPRGGEDRKRLVTAQLDQGAVVLGHGELGGICETLGQPRRLLVAVLLREARVAANVGDQKRPHAACEVRAHGGPTPLFGRS